MISPLYLLRVASLLASASWNLMSEDPRGFAGKLAERIRQSDNPVLSALPSSLLKRLAESPVSDARKLIDAGHLTAGVQYVAGQGRAASRGDIHLAKRTLERLEQLTAPLPVAWETKVRPAREHRVLHVLTNSKPFTASGYTVRSHNVLTSQQEAGINVQAVTRLGYPVLVGKIPASSRQIIDGVTYHRFLPWLYPPTLNGRTELTVRLLVEMARAVDATILHTTTDYTNALVVAEAAKRLGLPWVYEVRGELESTWLSRQPRHRQHEAIASEFYRLARSKEAACASSASAVVTLSEISRDDLIARGVPAELITVIPNAIDSADIGHVFDQQSVREELGLPPGPLYGTVTSVVDYEGLDTLIRALKYLSRDTRVLIVGDGTARPGLQRLAQELRVSDRVIFAGRQPQNSIWRWYAVLDAFVVPRRDIAVSRKVTPLKPLTAQALGIPVVASDLPALREVTGGLARYVPADDPQSLAETLKSLDTFQNKQEEIAEWLAGRTWSANAERYRQVYNSLVSR